MGRGYNMGLVFCIQCKSLKCNEAVALQTGFVIVDTNTGEPDPDGIRVNAGVHVAGGAVEASKVTEVTL